MQCNNTSAASCHRDARDGDGDLRAAAGMVIASRSGERLGFTNLACACGCAISTSLSPSPSGQGQGKGSRSMRVEASGISGRELGLQYSRCRTTEPTYTTAWDLSRCSESATKLKLHNTTSSNLQEHIFQPPGISRNSNRHDGLVRQELHPGTSHGLPSHRHHCCRHHGRQCGGRCWRPH